VKEYNFLIKGKGKVMIVPVRYKKTHVLSEDKSMTLLILNFDAIWRWMVSFRPRPHYRQEIN